LNVHSFEQAHYMMDVHAILESREVNITFQRLLWNDLN
jgi:hypothetical protein